MYITVRQPARLPDSLQGSLVEAETLGAMNGHLDPYGDITSLQLVSSVFPALVLAAWHTAQVFLNSKANVTSKL